ncbi:MAG: acyl-CoA dehydrogenase family protein, partial [Gammaproteobacteria bacterium]
MLNAPVGTGREVGLASDSEKTPLQLAEEFAPRIAALADEIEQAKELPPALAADMGDAGLFRLLVPKRYGGVEMAFPEFIGVVQTLARADGSVAWCVNQGCIWATNAAFLPPTTAKEIWSDPRAAVANGPPVWAEAREVDGGHEISGQWMFSSGCRHATWLSAMASVEGGHMGPQGRIFFLPISDAEIVDAWDVAGLRGTGSHQFRVDKLFVPEARGAASTAESLVPGPLYFTSLGLKFACGFASVALGVARGALDFAKDLATGKHRRFSSKLLKDEAWVQEQIGRAETLWHAADTFLHVTVSDVWDSITAKRAISNDERVMLRMAGTHTIRQAVDVVDLAYNVCGTDGIFQDREIQRRFQDIHVIS